MERKLVVATHNKNKLNEIKDILLREGVEVELLSLYDLHFDTDIPEDGACIEDNALQKARFIYKRFNMDCFADDTGLEVNALNGAPGVYSARYAGPQCDPTMNIHKLLRQLKPHKDRRARFRTVIALILNGKEYIFEGAINGEILHDISGGRGFGYDPIFLPDGETRSFAMMSDKEKNRISHRAIAIEKLAVFLKGYKS